MCDTPPSAAVDEIIQPYTGIAPIGPGARVTGNCHMVYDPYVQQLLLICSTPSARRCRAARTYSWAPDSVR
ncbi:hypothetical protein [Nocardia mikamii]|uniref:hypothetical protein n=1 Tax=Nocardia mikamii TaxID=508464 RepID=UPI0007A375B3|nr:hypothetical protein [Nocardia mikamii]